jgi:hypothetical protein
MLEENTAAVLLALRRTAVIIEIRVQPVLMFRTNFAPLTKSRIYSTWSLVTSHWYYFMEPGQDLRALHKPGYYT